MLFATLPFEAGAPTDDGRLAPLPVFLARGDQDHVIPADLLDRTWRYLHEESGAPLVARRSPGGHGLTTEIVADLGVWVGELLSPHLRAVPASLATQTTPRATHP